MKTKSAKSTGHIFGRNGLLYHIIEGNIEGVLSEGKTKKKT